MVDGGRTVIDLIPGVLLGLGLFVLVGSDSRRRLVRRLAPHIRDVAPIGAGDGDSGGPAAVLTALVRIPRDARHRRRHNRTVDDELADVLDMFALGLSAGMTVPVTLERIGLRGSGVLSAECRRISAEISLGVSVADALHASSDRLGHEGWTRLIDHLTTARRHGTPLADIVRSLADDEASAAGRRLMESASARETMMMFPLVFGILPATVLVAVFPGVTAIGVLV